MLSLEKSAGLQNVAQVPGVSGYMKKMLVANKVATHFFITPLKSKARTFSLRWTDFSRLKVFRLAVVLLIANLAACSLGGGGAPQVHYYRLPAITVEKQPQPRYREILIRPVKASGLYHERAILYSLKEKPLELKRYHYRLWVQTPAELIHQALYQGLSASGLAQQPGREPAGQLPDITIDTGIISFERIIEGSQVTVRVALEVSLSREAKDFQWTGQYQSMQQLQTTEMHSSAEAFGRALQEITSMLVDDLLKTP